MKKFLTLALCGAAVLLQGAVLGEYVFKNKTAQDISPKALHPLNMPEFGAFVDDAVDLSVSGGIKLPTAAFPGANGTIETELQVKNKAGYSFLLCYYGGGDVMNIICSSGRFQVCYFDRSSKKWYNSKWTKAVPYGEFVKLNLVWTMPGKIELTVNNSKVAVPVEVEGGFVPRSSVMMLGSNQRGESVFPGLVKNFKLTDGK